MKSNFPCNGKWPDSQDLNELVRVALVQRGYVQWRAKQARPPDQVEETSTKLSWLRVPLEWIKKFLAGK